MASFEAVASEYDAARPSYPSGLYDALGDLHDVLALDVGAGTGIATRQLLERGARVVAVDSGVEILRRGVAHTPVLPAVVAGGSALPVRDRSVDIICFAQSWHWLAESKGSAEAHRVLTPGGRWAAWWSHARADHEPWFDAYWTLIEHRCPGTHRIQRDTDWGATLDSGLFSVSERVVVPWLREVTVDEWLTDQMSHSYVAGAEPDVQAQLLHGLREVLIDRFPTRAMTVDYETWLWTATRR